MGTYGLCPDGKYPPKYLFWSKTENSIFSSDTDHLDTNFADSEAEVGSERAGVSFNPHD